MSKTIVSWLTLLLAAAGILVALVLLSSRPVAATPSLQLPWPNGVEHRIYGGYTYGCGTHADVSRNYFAIDLVFATGDSVSATASGTVVNGTTNPDLDARGNFLEVDHGGGYRSRYLHLRASAPWATGIGIGSQVSQGQTIGYSGGTGGFEPHLHFDMQYYDGSGSHAYRAEPMSGVSGFGWYGYSVESGIGASGCSNNINDPSPFWTSQAPCDAPPGGVANEALYREKNRSDVYITYDNTKYGFSTQQDFIDMGTVRGFSSEDTSGAFRLII